jgi:chromosome segregation ATPase
MSEEKDKQQQTKSGTGIYILIILLLLVGLGAVSMLWSKKNKELNDCTNENTLLKADMEGMNEMMSGYVDNMSKDIKTDFKNMLKTYDELILKDKSKADSLNVQKQKIMTLMDDLESAKKNGRLNARKIAQMNREIETLRSIMKSYVIQIDSLNTLNVKLTSDLDQTNTKLTATAQERDQYKQEAEQSAAQVKKGSRLQALGIQTDGLRMKLNNTTEVSNKAKNVVQIRSSFTISENPITAPGPKVVYLQVINPEGRTLQTRSTNVIQTESGPVSFSDKKEIDYRNQQIDMSIYYDFKGEEAVKGNYSVKIYCDGNLVGSDTFTLK